MDLSSGVQLTHTLFSRWRQLLYCAIMAWLIVQALVNIGSVIGMLPVVGVPLPLVSSGGSSLITTMGALGILMSFARSEPGCAERLAGRPSILRRTAAVVATPRRSLRGRR